MQFYYVGFEKVYENELRLSNRAKPNRSPISIIQATLRVNSLSFLSIKISPSFDKTKHYIRFIPARTIQPKNFKKIKIKIKPLARENLKGEGTEFSTLKKRIGSFLGGMKVQIGKWISLFTWDISSYLMMC